MEDDEAYRTKCYINFTFKFCYHSCEKCYLDINNSNDKYHNCINCNINYYPSPSNKSNCFSIEEKEINWYLDLVNSEFYFCHEKCRSCIGPSEFNCSSCYNGYYLDNNFCTSNYSESYFSINTEINSSSYLYSCPHNYEIRDNKCIFKSFYSETSFIEFKNQIRSENISSFTNSSKIINGLDFLAMIFYSDEITPEKQIKNGISAIDLGNCTNIIKDYYNISKNESIIVVNIELKNEENQNNRISKKDSSYIIGKYNQIEIYDNLGSKLDLSICKDDIKLLKFLGDIEKIDFNSAKILSEKGIDIFNAADNFFNDLCYYYDNPYNKDIIINDRRTDIYKNITFCQNECRYEGINYNLNAANCLCSSNSIQEVVNITIDTLSSKENVNFKTLSKIFLENIFSFNFEVLKCYNLVFNKKILPKNIGFHCLLLMLVLQIIFFFIFFIKKLNSIKYFMFQFHLKVKKKRKSHRSVKILNENYLKNKNNHRNSKNLLKANPPKKKKTKQKSSIQLNNNKLINDNNNKNLDDINESIKEENNKKKKIEEGYDLVNKLNNKESFNALNIQSLSKSKFKSKKSLPISNHLENNNNNIYNVYNNNIEEKDNFSKYKNLIKHNKEKGKQLANINNNISFDNLEPNKEQIKKNIHIKNKIHNIKDDSNHLLQIIYGLQDMDYEEAIIKDNRSYLKMYLGFLVDSQIILNTFFTDNHLDLFIIKLIFLVYTFQISFFLNAFFFTDEYISDAYHNDGLLDFFSGLPKSIYSFIATLITTNILRMLSSSRSELINLIKLQRKNKNYFYLTHLKLKKLRIKLIVYFILVYLFSFLFLYYVTAFCAVYRYSQKYWFYGCLESIIMDSIASFITCIFLALFRYISVKKNIKCFFILANIISTFI